MKYLQLTFGLLVSLIYISNFCHLTAPRAGGTVYFEESPSPPPRRRFPAQEQPQLALTGNLAPGTHICLERESVPSESTEATRQVVQELAFLKQQYAELLAAHTALENTCKDLQAEIQSTQTTLQQTIAQGFTSMQQQIAALTLTGSADQNPPSYDANPETSTKSSLGKKDDKGTT